MLHLVRINDLALQPGKFLGLTMFINRRRGRCGYVAGGLVTDVVFKYGDVAGAR